MSRSTACAPRAEPSSCRGPRRGSQHVVWPRRCCWNPYVSSSVCHRHERNRFLKFMFRVFVANTMTFSGPRSGDAGTRRLAGLARPLGQVCTRVSGWGLSVVQESVACRLPRLWGTAATVFPFVPRFAPSSAAGSGAQALARVLPEPLGIPALFPRDRFLCVFIYLLEFLPCECVCPASPTPGPSAGQSLIVTSLWESLAVCTGPMRLPDDRLPAIWASLDLPRRHFISHQWPVMHGRDQGACGPEQGCVACSRASG